MKTLKEINQEIESIRLKFNESLTKIEVKRLNARLDFLKSIAFYLETNPSEDFLKNNKKSIKETIDSLNSKYDQWMPPKDKDSKRWRSIFESSTGIKKMKAQLRTLTFILA